MGWMKGAMVGAVLAVVACGNTTTTDAPKRAAELPATATAGKNDNLTDFYTDARGAVELDDTLFDRYAPSWPNYYNGYRVELEAGDIVTLRAGAVSAGFDTVIGLYGPQQESGDWGELLAANDDANGSLDSEIAFEATDGGGYLLLLQEYDWNSGDLWVSAECDGGPCTTSQCLNVVCALWCEHGFVHDDNGCETCACEPGPGAQGDACSMYGQQCDDGLVCAYECPDGSGDTNCNLGINPSGSCVVSAACNDGDSQSAGDGCNTCTCSAGAWACTEMACAPAECVTDDDCFKTGCSGQICAAEHMVTTCEWHSDYACYTPSTTSCGCANGSCGWEPTAALSACLGS